MIIPRYGMILKAIDANDYKTRAIGEYWFVKDKYEKLHKMIIRREAGKLDFTPNCTMEQWKAQASAMGQYLYQLELKACIEDIDLDSLYYEPNCESIEG